MSITVQLKHYLVGDGGSNKHEQHGNGRYSNVLSFKKIHELLQ